MVDIICLSSWRGIGGAQMNAAMLVKEFENRGYVVELGFLFDREPEVVFDASVPFIIAKDSPKKIRDWFLFFSSIKFRLYSKNPKVIFGFHPFSNVIGALVSLFLPNCIFIGTQRNPSDSQSPSVSVLESITGRWLYHSNICVTQVVADSFSSYSRKYKENIKVVHNGAPPLIDSPFDKNVCRDKFSIKHGCFVLGCLGRLHDQKNVSFAIDVVAGCENTMLYIAGVGPLEEQLKEKVVALGIGERVVFLGSIHGQDITSFYKAIDVLLFPSLFEGFGRVLIEALSEGVLVLANDIPVVREVAGVAAVLLPLDSNKWISTVTSIQSNYSKFEGYSLKGVERSQLFSVDSMVDQYLEAAGLPERKNA
jgi:glycosyltransferase involved in cell wall biosynthesis